MGSVGSDNREDLHCRSELHPKKRLEFHIARIRDMTDEETMKLSEAHADETLTRELISMRGDVSCGGRHCGDPTDLATVQVAGAQEELEGMHGTLAKENEHFRDGNLDRIYGCHEGDAKLTNTTVTTSIRDGRGRQGVHITRARRTKNEGENHRSDGGKWIRTQCQHHS